MEPRAWRPGRSTSIRAGFTSRSRSCKGGAPSTTVGGARETSIVKKVEPRRRFIVKPGRSAGEQGCGDAADTRDAREHAARQRLLAHLGLRQRLGGRGDEERAIVGTAEGAARPARDG